LKQKQTKKDLQTLGLYIKYVRIWVMISLCNGVSGFVSVPTHEVIKDCTTYVHSAWFYYKV